MALMQDLAEFCTGDDFVAATETFLDKHCDAFRDFDPNQEQQHEWGERYKEYVAIVEEQLESFCKANDVDAEHVMESVAKAIADPLGKSEFLPEFIRSTDYVTFGEQMKHRALAGANRGAALDAADKAGPHGFSGLWMADPTPGRNDPEKLQKYLVEYGCPWYARKAIKFGSNFIKDTCIIQTAETCRWVYRLKFFGTTSVELKLQKGLIQSCPNLWQKKVSAECWAEGDTMPAVWTDEPYTAPGTKHTSLWEFVPGTNRQGLTWLNELEIPNGDGTHRKVSFTQYFVRQDQV